MKLSNKTAIITGGASGMGGATSKLFCKEGAKVAILDINEKAGHEIVSEINLSGGEAVFLKTDVSKSEEISKSVDDVIKKFNKIDILFKKIDKRND